MRPSAVTTDGAGSSRIPASCCGFLGLKATLGRIPNEDGADLFGAFSYIGAMTRTTGDLVMMLNAMSGAGAGRSVGSAACPRAELPSEPASPSKALACTTNRISGTMRWTGDVSQLMERVLEMLGANGVIVEGATVARIGGVIWLAPVFAV